MLTKRIGSIKEQIKNNEQQAEELEEFYDDYVVKQKEKRLTKRQTFKFIVKRKRQERYCQEINVRRSR